jgi:hypothetical protein
MQPKEEPKSAPKTLSKTQKLSRLRRELSFFDELDIHERYGYLERYSNEKQKAVVSKGQNRLYDYNNWNKQESSFIWARIYACSGILALGVSPALAAAAKKRRSSSGALATRALVFFFSLMATNIVNIDTQMYLGLRDQLKLEHALEMELDINELEEF